MDNPFYIPKRRKALDIANIGLQLMSLKQRGDIAKQAQTATKRDFTLRENIASKEYGHYEFPEGPKGKRVYLPGLRERHISLEEQKVESAQKTQLASWHRDMSGEPKVLEMKAISDKFKATAPIFNSIIEGVKNDRIKSRYDVFNELSRVKSMGGFKTIQDNLIKDAKRLKDKGENDEAQEHLNLALSITKPGFLRTYFGFPAELLPKQPTSTKLYATERGYLPAPEAIGLKPYDKPPKPPTEIQKETHEIKKQKTEAEARRLLTEEPDSRATFDSYGAFYNKNNKRNEVVYWDSSGWDEETVTIKLPVNATSAGWTPDKIQNMAEKKGITVEELLSKLGIIE